MNILIYANLARSPFHRVAQERLTVLDEQGINLWISRQVLREYLAAMTRRGDILSYRDLENGKEMFVGGHEMGGGQIILPGPMAPGSVYSIARDFKSCGHKGAPR